MERKTKRKTKLKKNERIVYLDYTDFLHHLDREPDESSDPHPVRVYNTIEDCKAGEPCWSECGIIRAKLQLLEWLPKPDAPALASSASSKSARGSGRSAAVPGSAKRKRGSSYKTSEAKKPAGRR